jgi:hypothetical protein
LGYETREIAGPVLPGAPYGFGHLPLLDVAQDGRQIVLFAQRPMSVFRRGRFHRQGLVPPGQKLFLQVRVGRLDGAHSGPPHAFHQAVLSREKLALHAPLGLGRVRRNPDDPQLA